LLLADPSDGRGVALFDLARHAVQHHGVDAWVAPGEGRRTQIETLVGTAALAVAAQQRGEITLAQQLSHHVAAEAHALMRTGGEATFWLLATAGYGVFGLSAPDAVIVDAGGTSRRVSLVGGRAIVPLDAHGSGSIAASVTVPGNDTGSNLFARIEALSDRNFTARTDSPIVLELQGDPGYAGEVAALELSVHNRGTTRIGRSVVEIQLPAASGFGEVERAALASRPGIQSVEVRDGGLVRVVLEPLAGAENRILPLAVRWLARGRVSGFGVAAYGEDEPSRLTVLAPRSIDLRQRPND
jgi:hypothetical protein